MNKNILKQIKKEPVKDIILDNNGFSIITEKHQINIFYDDNEDCSVKISNNAPNINFRSLCIKDIHLSIECRPSIENRLNTTLVFIITMERITNICISIKIDSRMFFSFNLKTVLYNIKPYNTEFYNSEFYNAELYNIEKI